MESENKTGNIEDSIKAELEHVYVMASYVDAEEGRLEIVKHLISAAIDEMESIMAKTSSRYAKPIRLVGAGPSEN